MAASCSNDIDIYHQCHQAALSEDVIIEILSRLPVKLLIRAKAVCKEWYTIIKNPSFVTKHFNRHTDNSGRLFVQREDRTKSAEYVLSFFLDETLAGTPLVYQDVVATDIMNPIVVVASPYNGILCLANYNFEGRFGFHRFVLWNPATREFRALPVLPRNLPPMAAIYEEVVGFGMDPITNDYKLVWIWKIIYDIDDEMYGIEEITYGPYQVALYTLSTDSWRYLDPVAWPYWRIHDPSSNTCIDGVYHWRAVDIDNLRVNVILSFDMGNELFHEVRDIPCSKKEFTCITLAPYYNNNSLALFYSDSPPFIELWVRMEEGWCWTKQFTMSSIYMSPVQVPLGFWKNGQLFMDHGDDHHAVLYDPETRESKDLGFHCCRQFFIYRESLVSIRGGDGDGDGDGFLEQDHLSDVDQVLKNELLKIADQPGF